MLYVGEMSIASKTCNILFGLAYFVFRKAYNKKCYTEILAKQIKAIHV